MRRFCHHRFASFLLGRLRSAFATQRYRRAATNERWMLMGLGTMYLLTITHNTQQIGQAKINARTWKIESERVVVTAMRAALAAAATQYKKKIKHNNTFTWESLTWIINGIALFYALVSKKDESERVREVEQLEIYCRFQSVLYEWQTWVVNWKLLFLLGRSKMKSVKSDPATAFDMAIWRWKKNWNQRNKEMNSI